MRKFLFLCAAFVACAFVGCDKPNTDPEGTGTGDTAEYTLVITPSPTASLSEDLTLTVKGDDAETMSWRFCYENETTGAGNCIPSFDAGNVKVFTPEIMESLSMKPGKYHFYASTSEVQTANVYVTLE